MNKFKAKIQALKREAEKKGELVNINPGWIKDKMKALGIKQKKLQEDWTLDKSSISTLLSGSRSLSKRTKVAFYYYLAYKEQLAINKQLLKIVNNTSKVPIHQVTLQEAIEKEEITKALKNK